jgi:hypothetical protein
VGEEVKGVYTGVDQVFEFTAPANGRLVAQLTWNIWATETILDLELLGDIAYTPTPPRWIPLIGTWNVRAGQNYRLAVRPSRSYNWSSFDYYWGYGDPFVLTTAME